MKLIGSKTERDFKEILIKSRKSLFEGEDKNGLLRFIKNYHPGMRTAYIIQWIPEQGEDIFRVLINDNLIIEIELDRNNQESEPIINSIDLYEFNKKLSRQTKIKLAVAIELAKSELADTATP